MRGGGPWPLNWPVHPRVDNRRVHEKSIIRKESNQPL